MGGDSWTATGRYLRDLEAAFRQIQADELADGRFGDARTGEELWKDPEWREYVFTGGSGSVLDCFEFASGEGCRNEAGRMRLLTDTEVRMWFPDGKPTFADWNDAEQSPDWWSDLHRAEANCMVLYRDGEPSEIAYWGITAD